MPSRVLDRHGRHSLVRSHTLPSSYKYGTQQNRLQGAARNYPGQLQTPGLHYFTTSPPPKCCRPAGAVILFAAVAALLAINGADASYGHRQHGSSMASRFLAPHNAARRAVGVRPLAWDAGLERHARRYALARALTGCALVHSHGAFGENLFRGSGVGGGGGWTPEAVVRAWVVKERAMYDVRSNSCRGPPGACGHYTQIVWRGTTKVGCAMATCAGGRGTFAVCVYNPPGNYVGVRPY